MSGAPVSDEDLLARADEARARAYAPYSRYAVGAAAVVDGQLFEGANVENATYGLTICAERNVIARAVLEGHRAVERIAVVTESSPPAAPCGMCLQALLEFAPDPGAVRVLLANPRGERRSFTLAELVPYGFRPTDLSRRG